MKKQAAIINKNTIDCKESLEKGIKSCNFMNFMPKCEKFMFFYAPTSIFMIFMIFMRTVNPAVLIYTHKSSVVAISEIIPKTSANQQLQMYRKNRFKTK